MSNNTNTEKNDTNIATGKVIKFKDKLMIEVLEERCTYLEEQVRELNDRLTRLEKQCEFDRTVII